MSKMRIIPAIALSIALAGTAAADTVKLDGAVAGDDSRPSRGMTQDRVQAKYGSPKNTEAPVGDPPITRWEYQDFVVFFEHDKVIHAVLKR